MLSTTELRPVLAVNDRSCEILVLGGVVSFPSAPLALSFNLWKKLSRGVWCAPELRLVPARGVRGGDLGARAYGAGVAFRLTSILVLEKRFG